MFGHLFTKANNLCLSDSILHDFVINHPYGTHIKDTKTGAFIDCNLPLLKIFGFVDAKQLIGLNILDLDKVMHPYWGNHYPQQVIAMESRVKTTRKMAINKKEILLNANNQVYIQDMFKFPLMGTNNKVNAILTTVVDRTREFDVFHLLYLYENMYKDRHTSLVNFVKFLGISDYFHENLTYKEIVCLLHMCLNPSHKSIAQKLNICTKTVETHVSHIISKLKCGQLCEVLSHLRSKQKP